jgi:hypothetical protein
VRTSPHEHSSTYEKHADNERDDDLRSKRVVGRKEARATRTLRVRTGGRA